MLNIKQQQKFPNLFANKFSREMYNNSENKIEQNMKQELRLKTETTSQNDSSGNSQSLPFANCPPVPPPTPEEQGSAGAQIAAAMGVQSCKTSAFSAQAEIDAFITSASMSVSGSSAVGCEEIQIMANSYHQSQKNISCTIKQSITDSTTSVTNLQRVRIEAGKDLITECTDFTIDQNAEIKLISLTQLTQQQISDIQKAVKTTAEDIVKAAQESKSGFGATPQGQKFVSDAKTKIESQDFNQNVAQSINKITTSVESAQEIKLTAGGNIVLRGANCKLSQNAIIDVMASSILNDSLGNIFNDLTEITKKTDTSSSQESQNEGMPNLFQGKWLKYLLLGIALIVLFGGASYALSKQDLSSVAKTAATFKKPGLAGKL